MLITGIANCHSATEHKSETTSRPRSTSILIRKVIFHDISASKKYLIIFKDLNVNIELADAKKGTWKKEALF